MKIFKTVKSSIILLFLCFSLLLVPFGVGMAEAGENAFGQLPAVCQKYLSELSELRSRYKAANNEDEKIAIKAEAKSKAREFKDAVEKLNSIAPLAGKDIPFKVVSDLPFTVNGVKITSASEKGVKFSIQTRIEQDVKDSDGKLSQRMNVYFIAYDSKGQKIPKTGNWATNHGWIELSAGTIYDAQGHWNADRVQAMGDFGLLKIMSRDEYDNLK